MRARPPLGGELTLECQLPVMQVGLVIEPLDTFSPVGADDGQFEVPTET